MIDNLIVVEFSLSQDCFHQHKLDSMLRHNWSACANRAYDADYLPVGVFETEDEAYSFIKKVEPIFRRKDTDG